LGDKRLKPVGQQKTGGLIFGVGDEESQGWLRNFGKNEGDVVVDLGRSRIW
jgi:hypothetical protein